MVKKFIKLMLVIIWMGLIFSFSSDTGDVSTKKSDSFIINVVEKFYGRKLSNSERKKWIEKLVIITRKGAHLGVYFILGILIFNFVVEFSCKKTLISVIISFIYACSDEFHQLFVNGRSGMVSDVILDTIGSCLGISFLVFIVRMCKKYEQKERIS